MAISHFSPPGDPVVGHVWNLWWNPTGAASAPEAPRRYRRTGQGRRPVDRRQQGQVAARIRSSRRRNATAKGVVKPVAVGKKASSRENRFCSARLLEQATPPPY